MTQISLINSTTEFSKSEIINVAVQQFEGSWRNNFILDKDKTQNIIDDAEQRKESAITFKCLENSLCLFLYLEKPKQNDK